MRTSSWRKSPNLRRQKSPNLNLATGFMKNVKQWKGLRWWEVEHSPREGPCSTSHHLRPFHCLYQTKYIRLIFPPLSQLSWRPLVSSSSLEGWGSIRLLPETETEDAKTFQIADFDAQKLSEQKKCPLLDYE